MACRRCRSGIDLGAFPKCDGCTGRAGRVAWTAARSTFDERSEQSHVQKVNHRSQSKSRLNHLQSLDLCQEIAANRGAIKANSIDSQVDRGSREGRPFAGVPNANG
jgi:hypothetical protein